MRHPRYRNTVWKLLAGAVAGATALAVSGPAAASDPSATTLSDPGVKTRVTRHFTGSVTGALVCTPLTCDSHDLHMNVPDNFWAKHNGRVIVSIAWDVSSADLDLAVYDSGGSLVARAAHNGSGPETVNLGELAPGDYTIDVWTWIAPPDTPYTGTISMKAKSLVKKHRERRRG